MSDKLYIEPKEHYPVNRERSAEEALELALKELRAGKTFRALHASAEAAKKCELIWEANYR